MMISLFGRKTFPVKFFRESVCKILKLLRELTSKIGKSIEKRQNSLLFSLFSGNSRRSGIAILFLPLTPAILAKRNTPFYPSEISALRKGGAPRRLRRLAVPNAKARRGQIRDAPLRSETWRAGRPRSGYCAKQ
jgi:hypothetical protein